MPAARRRQITLHELLIGVAILGVLLAWVIPVVRISPIWVAAFAVPAAFVTLASFRRFTTLQIMVMVTLTCATVALPLLSGVALLYAKYAATFLLLGVVWILFLRRRRRRPRIVRQR